MPVHNSAQFVEESIESVVNQTIQDWELIVVDDCSNDDSFEVLGRVALKDRRIKVIALSENSGAAVARNTGIEAARGRYIAFLDSDDLWMPHKLERQIGYMEETAAAFVHSAYERIDEKGRSLDQVVRPPARIEYQELLKANRIGCLTAIYDTHTLGKVYMPLLRKRQDYALWLELLKCVDHVHCLPDVLARYRVRSGSISSNKIEMIKWHWRLFRQVEGLPIHRSLYYLGHNVYRKLVE